MLKYNCPKCGEMMQSPVSMVGKSETCPACGGQVKVRRGLGTMLFGSRTRWLVTGAVVVLLAVVVGVVAHESRYDGTFPPRVEVANILARHHLYQLSAEPSEKILRGRKLAAYSYADSANYSEQTSVATIYCDLADHDIVHGVAIGHSRNSALKGVSRALNHQTVSYPPYGLIDEFVGGDLALKLEPKSKSTDDEDTLQTVTGTEESSWESWGEVNGYIVEYFLYERNGIAWSNMTIIRDNSWHH